MNDAQSPRREQVTNCPGQFVQRAPGALVQLIDLDVDSAKTKPRGGGDRGANKGAIYLNDVRLVHLCPFAEFRLVESIADTYGDADSVSQTAATTRHNRRVGEECLMLFYVEGLAHD